MSTIFTSKIESLKRLQNSVSGNPRFQVTLTNGKTLTTKRDAIWVFGLDSIEFLGGGLKNKPKPNLSFEINNQNEIVSIDVLG